MDGESSVDQIIRIYMRDVDRTLIRENLRRTVTERFEANRALQEFAEEVRRSPGRIAARCRQETITYAELDRASNRVAHALLGEGLVPGAIVPLLAERGLGYLAAVIGIMKAGGVYLPLDPGVPEARLRTQLKLAASQVALVDAKSISILEGSVRALPLEAALRAGRDDAPGGGFFGAD